MARKFDKEKFLKTEFGVNLQECIKMWDSCLATCENVGSQESRVIRRECLASYRAQWDVYQMAMKQFYGIEYHFTRTEEYFGVCTEDEADWLFKIER